VVGLKAAGVVDSGGGKVRLLQWEEYPDNWNPTKDERTPIWEAAHHMIRMLKKKGESDAGALLARMPERAERIRQLAYHLYTICERKKWAEQARAYNELITSWHAIVAASHDVGHVGTQAEMEF
jgi:putative DNA methylase